MMNIFYCWRDSSYEIRGEGKKAKLNLFWFRKKTWLYDSENVSSLREVLVSDKWQVEE